MNFFTKYRIIAWILAGLLILAMSALGSVIYHVWLRTEVVTEVQTCSSTCRMMTVEIGFDDSQNTALHGILEEHRDTSEILLAALEKNRIALMEELRNELPDTTKIRLLAWDIGRNQASLTALAAAQYLKIRSICSPEQRIKLSDIYCDLFGCPRLGIKPGEDNGQHRHRFGKPWK